MSWRSPSCSLASTVSRPQALELRAFLPAQRGASSFRFFSDIQRTLFFTCIHLCWLCWVFTAARAFSDCSERGCSCTGCPGSSLQWLLLLQSVGSRASRLQQLQFVSSRPQAQQLWLTGLVALQHVGSFQNRDRNMSPALAGRFFTAEPPGKSPLWVLIPLCASSTISQRTLLSEALCLMGP